MRSVARRTGKACVDVARMLRETAIADDLREVVALGAHPVGTGHAQIRGGKQIGNRPARDGGLTELVTPLEEMEPLRSVGPVCARTAEFAVIVAVVAIGSDVVAMISGPFSDSLQ